jgi:hypothetical protein
MGSKKYMADVVLPVNLSIFRSDFYDLEIILAFLFLAFTPFSGKEMAVLFYLAFWVLP